MCPESQMGVPAAEGTQRQGKSEQHQPPEVQGQLCLGTRHGCDTELSGGLERTVGEEMPGLLRSPRQHLSAAYAGVHGCEQHLGFRFENARAQVRIQP